MWTAWRSRRGPTRASGSPSSRAWQPRYPRKRRWVAGEPCRRSSRLRSVFHPSQEQRATALRCFDPFCGSMVPDPTTTARRPGERCHHLMQAFARAPFRAGRPVAVRLHSHAARKTFAKFVVKRDKRSLRRSPPTTATPTAEFTDGVYVGTDFETHAIAGRGGSRGPGADADELVEQLAQLARRPRASRSTGNS